MRQQHVFNAETRKYNPGVPLAIQLMLGYTGY